MAHRPKPFFRTARNAWYVQLGKQQIKLADGPQTAATEAAAWQRFHELMAAPPSEKNSANSARVADGLTVAGLFDKYLDWCQKHRAGRTYTDYVWHLQNFLDWAKPLEPAALPATALKPFHVQEWVDSHDDWGPTYRRNAIASVKRAYNWAEELGYIDSNPVRKVKKPAAARREQAVTPVEWETIRDHYPDGDPFRDLLEFSWETGCRPQEAKRIEARHADLARHRIVFPKEEAKGKKKARVIFLTPRAEAILARRVPKAGHVFLNADGNQWTTDAMNCRFCRLKKTLGVKYAAYSLRHGFATRKLEAGMDHLTVAALMGHQDGTMIAKTYSHISDRDDYLQKKLNDEG